MKRNILLIYVIVMILLFHCSNENPTEPSWDVRFITLNDAIRIDNQSDWEVHYFAVEQLSSNIIDWIPYCSVGSQKQIPCGKTAYVVYSKSEIPGYYEGCTIRLYWWFCNRDDAIEGAIHSILLQTK